MVDPVMGANPSAPVTPDLIRGRASTAADTVQWIKGGPTGQPTITRVPLASLRNRKGPRA